MWVAMSVTLYEATRVQIINLLEHMMTTRLCFLVTALLALTMELGRKGRREEEEVILVEDSPKPTRTLASMPPTPSPESSFTAATKRSAERAQKEGGAKDRTADAGVRTKICLYPQSAGKETQEANLEGSQEGEELG